MKPLTEDEAVAQIKRDCHSGDFEGNGCMLDKIIERFLRDNGFERLADAMDRVDCWRA